MFLTGGHPWCQISMPRSRDIRVILKLSCSWHPQVCWVKIWRKSDNPFSSYSNASLCDRQSNRQSNRVTDRHTQVMPIPTKLLFQRSFAVKTALLTMWALDLYSRDGSCRGTRIRTRARRLETGNLTWTRLLVTQLVWPLDAEYGPISFGRQNVWPLLLLCLWVGLCFTVWLIALCLSRVGLWAEYASRR